MNTVVARRECNIAARRRALIYDARIFRQYLSLEYMYLSISARGREKIISPYDPRRSPGHTVSPSDIICASVLINRDVGHVRIYTVARVLRT